MNFRERIHTEPSGIAIAPMIDVVFLLLIFFLVTWNFARYETEIDVTVPAAKKGEETRRAVGEVIINIKRDGSIVLNRRSLSPEELFGHLKEISKLYPDQAVILRGDQQANYQHIVRVLDICREANIWNVAFATSKPD